MIGRLAQDVWYSHCIVFSVRPRLHVQRTEVNDVGHEVVLSWRGVSRHVDALQ
jgi:hypothetical protein